MTAREREREQLQAGGDDVDEERRLLLFLYFKEILFLLSRLASLH